MSQSQCPRCGQIGDHADCPPTSTSVSDHSWNPADAMERLLQIPPTVEIEVSKDIVQASLDVTREIVRTSHWPPYNSAHEAYGVLLEEVEEFWRAVQIKQKHRDPIAMRNELIQIAAVAIKAASICKGEWVRR